MVEERKEGRKEGWEERRKESRGEMGEWGNEMINNTLSIQMLPLIG